NTGIGILLSIVHHTVRRDVELGTRLVGDALTLPNGMEKQLRYLIVQLVDGQRLHFGNPPLAAASVDTAHQVSFFHGKKHNHISISFDFGFFVCSGFLAPLSGAVWACSLSFARTEVFF